MGDIPSCLRALFQIGVGVDNLSVSSSDELFYSFLAGLSDAEGNWQLSRKGRNRILLEFRIFSTDQKILSGINKQLVNRGFSCSVHLKERAGSRIQPIMLKHDYWVMRVSRHDDAVRLAELLLKYSLHPEKRRKLKFIQRYRGERYWSAIEKPWRELRHRISKEVENSKELARTRFEDSHGCRVSK